MNFFVDAYDLTLKAIYFALGFPLTDCFFYAIIFYLLIRKYGGKKFLWIKLKSLSDEQNGEDSEREYKKKRNTDLVWIALCFLGIKMMVLPVAMFKFFDDSAQFGDTTYSLERDELLLVAGLHGMTLIPFVWIPAYMGINKFRQWVDVETMVTWKYHDQRRKCFWSGYKDSCGYAMDMARALYRDDESLEIGLKYVEVHKDGDHYKWCRALTTLQRHAEQVENIEMYKNLVKKKCELDCNKACRVHKYAQVLPEHRLKNKFSGRSKLSSFLRWRFVSPLL